MLVQRTEYIKKLESFKDKDLIKVVTGVRRCGKSTLFELFIEKLKEGVEDERIIRVNLESPELDFKNYQEFYQYVVERLPEWARAGQSMEGRKVYVFLDEVQQVPEFQRAVDGLYLNKNLDLYITGSNATLLSGELATLLSGRYVEVRMLPYSFREYVKATGLAVDERTYTQYVSRGSFPYAVNLADEEATDDYLRSIYNTIIVKDVMQRRSIANAGALGAVTKFMLDNIGNLLSIKRVADTMTSDGRSISTHTVEGYLTALEESFIFYPAGRYDVKGRQYLQTGEKHYVVDVALQSAMLGRRSVDEGRTLENVVYLELIRRGYRVYVGKNEEKEVDFVAENKEGFLYVQVAYTARAEGTLERELAALRGISDHYPKVLLTMDVGEEGDYEGIRRRNVLGWLMEG